MWDESKSRTIYYLKIPSFWKVDELPEAKGICTPEEKFCLEYFDQTTTRDEDGWFVVKILFKPNKTELGSSYQVAKFKQLNFERRFESNPDFKDQYVKCMEEYIQQNNMSKSSKRELETFNLPLHAVMKESSQTAAPYCFRRILYTRK